jgi:hypothetical protein
VEIFKMPTASDNFNRANGALGSNWGYAAGLILAEIFNNAWSPPDVNTDGNCWVGGQASGSVIFGPDQFSQATIVNIASSVTYIGVRNLGVASFGGSINSYYGGKGGGALYQIDRYISGSGATLATGTHNPTIGDVVRLEIRGNVLTLYVNGTFECTAIDNTFTTGSPSLACNGGTVGVPLWDDWSGGDLIPASLLGPVGAEFVWGGGDGF